MDMSGYLQSLQLGNASLQSLSDTFSVVPFDQDFPSSPTAWNISIDRRFINMTRLKVATTRYHNSIDEPAWTEGPPRNNMSRLRDYWLNEYNWDDVEAKLNTQYNHFVTTVNLPYSNYSDPVKLHFVHHKSNRSDAIPLLFMHGTPGNFMEVYNILEPLINPPADQPAFHVVAPSMPGYGFSPAPRIPGMDPTIASGAMNQMMLQLGYDRYVVQGGDYGSIVLRYITGLYPQHVVSALANFFLVQPNATDLARYAANQTTPDETTYIKSIQNFGNSASGYRMLMALHPLQAVIAMTDSPIGNMAFGWDMMYYLSDPTYPWTLEEIITWGMMYWIPGPYAAWRHYREMSLHGVLAGPTLGNNYPFINQNIGITEFPGDFWYRLVSLLPSFIPKPLTSAA